MVLPRNTGQDMITTNMQLSHFLHKTSINKRPMEGNTMLQFLLHGAFIVLRSLPSDEIGNYFPIVHHVHRRSQSITWTKNHLEFFVSSKRAASASF